MSDLCHCCAGYTLHADIALACACSESPSLSTYVRYVLLSFMECLCLERTALLIRKAADFIHENNIIGPVGTSQPSWLDFASRDPTEENAVATRQLATLVALVALCFRFSQSSLQVRLPDADRAAIVAVSRLARLNLRPAPAGRSPQHDCPHRQSCTTSLTPPCPYQSTAQHARRPISSHYYRLHACGRLCG